MTVVWILSAIVLAALLLGGAVGLVALLEAGDPFGAPAGRDDGAGGPAPGSTR